MKMGPKKGWQLGRLTESSRVGSRRADYTPQCDTGIALHCMIVTLSILLCLRLEHGTRSEEQVARSKDQGARTFGISRLNVNNNQGSRKLDLD